MEGEKLEREIVNDFASKMYLKLALRHDRYTPLGWKTLDLKRILQLLEEEIEELKASDNKIFAKDNAIDIANYALFLHEIIK